MTNKECLEKLKQLNDMIEDYLDMMAIEDADDSKEDKKETK